MNEGHEGYNKRTRFKSDRKDKPIRRFVCTVAGCSYTTPYKKDLVRHMRKHTGEKPYTCELCSKQFSRYDKLMAHTKAHEGVRSRQCNFVSCTYSSIDSSALKRHVARMHCDIKPYTCQLCTYRAKDSAQMNIHVRFHTGDSPYNCTKCPKAFKTRTDLQRHLRIHNSEKPFQCSECPFRTSIKGNLTVHVKRKHNADLSNPETDRCSNRKIELNKTASEAGLPFAFSCKFCKFKTGTTKSFKLHMVKQHKTQDLDSALDKFNKPVKRHKSLLIPAESFLPKFHCVDSDGNCGAAFISEKSLQCHMRQHVSLHPPPAPTVEVIIGSSACESESRFLLTEEFPSVPTNENN